MAFIHYIRQHKRKLVVVGAAMVFFTYITKDGLRDSAKARADELEKSKAAYREALERTQDRVSIVGLALSIEALSYPKSKATAGYTPESVYEAADQRAFQVQVGYSLSIVNGLRESIPADGRLDELADDVTKKYGNLMRANSRLVDEFDDATKKQLEHAPASELDAADLCRQAHNETWLAFLSLANATIQDAEAETAWRQQVYHVFSWLSYGLYFLGWAIGLVGEFAKEEERPGPLEYQDPAFDRIGS